MSRRTFACPLILWQIILPGLCTEDNMPMGTKYRVVGQLNFDAAGYLLRVDGGGTWRLDLGLRSWWLARRWGGQRVVVFGMREGFDTLSVKRIERCDPRQS